MKKKCTLLQIFISIWKTMCMRIIPDLHLGIVETYCTSHFLGFLLCNAKKRHWEMPGLLKMFLLQKKRLSWISKKASDISPKRILGYTNQYRVFRRHKSIKAWKWLRTKVLVFFCENEKLTHISLPYNIFFKNVAGLIFLYKWCKLLLLTHPLDICCCNDTILYISPHLRVKS